MPAQARRPCAAPHKGLAQFFIGIRFDQIVRRVYLIAVYGKFDRAGDENQPAVLV